VGFEPTIPAGERPQTNALESLSAETSSNMFRGSEYDVVTAHLSQGPHQGQKKIWTRPFQVHTHTPTSWQVACLHLCQRGSLF